ncbi:MAG: hypothetical protein Greene041662_763 [Candidatus Peregrinibacteria bacterium Greene0416_62]|nr:MAG: hypothetical protein Greene041662_763 [Candidatus Peregrinibacteria bacterium Greene0416_62]TSD00075.1 MAG: hypothetical protein Greene101449_361 [Candidatus Peregrinibacteria bacterium Greene1014_49]
MHSSCEEDAALILSLQELYKGRRDVLDAITQNVNYSHSDAACVIDGVVKIHSQEMQRVLRHPKYSEELHTVSRLLNKYKNMYAEIFEDLRQSVHDHSGSEGTIHFTGHTARSSSIKSFNGRRFGNFLSQFSALRRTEDISGTPKLKAVSFRDGVIVTDIVDGTPLSNFPSNGQTPFHDGIIRDYLDRTFTMAKRSIRIDQNPSNFLLSARRIGIVDYDDKYLENSSTSESRAAQIFHSMLPLFMRHAIESPTDIEQRLTQANRETRITIRILRIIDRCFPLEMDMLRRAYQTRERDYLFNLKQHQHTAKKSSSHKHLRPVSAQVFSQAEDIESLLALKS